MSAIDELKALSDKYDMRADHFHKDPRGFVIMTRRGVEHVQAKIKAVVTFETVPEYSVAWPVRTRPRCASFLFACSSPASHQIRPILVQIRPVA